MTQQYYVKEEFPRLLEIAHPDKNKDIDFDTLTCGSGKTLYLMCDNPNHNWHASVKDLTRNDKRRIKECKFCKKGLVENHSWITKVWDYELNNDKPEKYTQGSHKRKFFKCLKCNESYKTTISNRIKAKDKEFGGCPYCSNQEVNESNSFEIHGLPILLKEFDNEKNNMKTSELTKKSTKKVWWKCSNCSSSWETSILKRMDGRGCPVCNNLVSKAEIITLHQMKYLFDNVEKLNTELNEIDVYLQDYKIGIEIDGSFHNKRKKQDTMKNKEYEKVGIKIFRLRDKSLGFCIDKNRDLFFDQKDLKKSDLDNLLKLMLDHISIKDQKTLERIDEFLKSDSFINQDDLLNDIQISKKFVPNNLEVTRPDLLSRWDYEKNILPPSSYSLMSNKKVWWKCKEGHSYEQDISKVTSRNFNCPYCSKSIIEGYNSCVDIYKDLYDFMKDPQSVDLTKYGIKSTQQVEWINGKHSIRSFIKNYYEDLKI